MRKILGAALAGTAVSLSALAQQKPAQETLLDRLIGQWVLRGSIRGKETIHDVHAEWVLNQGYVRVHEVSREKDATGRPVYEAIVFISWDPPSNEYRCLWLDTTGNSGLSADVIGRGKAIENKIPFVFNLPNGNKFYNTFVYDDNAHAWQWIMDNENGGKLQSFARLTLTPHWECRVPHP